MGYNLFKITELKDSFKQKLKSFVDTLGLAIRDGKRITFADNDISYVLDLQHKRIQHKGLTMDYEIYDRDLSSGAMVGSQWKDAHYESFVCHEQYGVKRTITRNGEKIYSDKKKNILYTTITDVTSGVHPDNEIISCPNCGNVSTIAEVEHGCAYCGTMYKMSDLFPKVTGYFFLEDVGIAGNEHKSGIMRSMLITTICMVLPVLIFGKGPLGIGKILTSLFMVPLGLLAGYFLYSIFMLFRLIIVGSRQSSGKWGTIGSRKKFEQKMKAYSPEFSFEYFTSKAISLIKAAIYSPNEQELPSYKGASIAPQFKDIIDLNYGGALGLSDFREENGTVLVATDAFFDVLYYEEGKIKNRRETFRAVFRRRIDIPIDMQFSMTRIQCLMCGASFNAVQNKMCPYCGNEYDIESQDWVLVELRI